MEHMHREGTVTKLREKVSAKPTLGAPIGRVKFTFRYVDGTALELEGPATDMTGPFLNETLQKQTKALIKNEISFMKVNRIKPIQPAPAQAPSNTANDGEVQITEQLAIQEAKPEIEAESAIAEAERTFDTVAELTFDTFNFLDVCRPLLLTEEGNHQKHLILQIVELDSLTEYAYNIDRSQWSLVRGLKYDYLVDGYAGTFPHKQKLLYIGEIYIHVFIPDKHKRIRNNGESEDEAAERALKLLEKAEEILVPIIPYIPQTNDIKRLLEAKDKIIKSKDDALDRAKEELAEKAVRNDAAAIAVSGHEIKNPDNATGPKKIDFTDYLIATLSTAGFGLLGWSFSSSYGWLASLIFGLPIGFLVIVRRK